MCGSPHAITGLIGLALLTFQSILPSLFEVLIPKKQRLKAKRVYPEQFQDLD